MRLIYGYILVQFAIFFRKTLLQDPVYKPGHS
jgi:hypothetical protein